MSRILIVDDAVTVRLFHRMAVEALGHEVVEAENGVEGIEKALAARVDLFLVDINMPRMDGFRFLEEVRRTDGLRDIPAIMISTEAEAGDRARAYASGANLFIVKPVNPARLQRLVALVAGEEAAA